MIVLDYLKKTIGDSICVPPFHTGHLGLLPNTEVSIGLMTLPETHHHCELVITPYTPSASDMAHVHCIMMDRPGVVQRLIDAVSLLNLNIVTQESSAINQLNHHSVDLLIDWSSSRFSDLGESEPAQQHRYSNYQALFPHKSAPYVLLFESIIAHCGNVLVRDATNISGLPHLSIRPLVRQHIQPHTLTKVERETGPGHRLHSRITIPNNILAHLHNRLRTAPHQQLHYAILSETENRTLRVFFPEPRLIDRIVHLGFYHRDHPGALAGITKLLAHEFNILTSLLRKTTPDLSVWEAMMEYRGKEVIPDDTKERCEWVAKHLSARATADGVESLSQYKFEVGLPLYPKPPRGTWSGRIGLEGLVPDSDSPEIHPDVNAILREKIGEALAVMGGGEEHMTQLLETVRTSIGQSKRSIFLSYPRNAKEHAGLIEAALGEEYDVKVYDLGGPEDITSAVLSLIAECDYFIGIWHHDENLPTADGNYGISPWMPFEYGIAKALKKPALVVHSDRLDEKIWKRVSPGIPNPEYKDLYFAKSAVSRIVEHCRRSFAKAKN